MDTNKTTRRLLRPFSILIGILSLLLLALAAYAAPAQTLSGVGPQTRSSGVLILVPGRMRQNDPLLSRIHNVTNTAFRYFRAHGYAPDDIYYLATDAGLDADGNGLADVDALATKANLQFAVTEWARHRLGPGQSMTLYMIGQGDQTRFYLNGMQGETVTPIEIDAWLDILESAVPGVRVSLVVDTCGAGAYVNASMTAAPRGRVVISSTGPDGNAWASSSGAAFSDPFLAALAQGKTLWDAFVEAAAIARQWHADQIPWLDADGNGVPNENTDQAVAAQRVLLPGGIPPTPTPTPVPTLTPDPYEPDDSCEQARPISTDGTPQSHSLHYYADTDWVSLVLDTGTEYLIEAIEDAPGTGLMLDLYDLCGNTNPGPFTGSTPLRQSSARLVIRPAIAGTYYLKVAPSSTLGFTPQRYILSVRRLTYRVYLPCVETAEDGFH